MTAAEPLPPTLSTCPIPEDNDALRDAITTLAGHINAAEYRFIKLLAALLEREAWLGDSGFKTPAHWLNYACGIDLGAARQKVRVAKCLANFPKIEEAFRLGTINYSKVRAMIRSATPENEEVLLMFAQHGTAQHVETLVRKHQYAKRLNDPEQDQVQYEAREFKWYTDEDGMLVFKGKLTPEDGAVFLKAMEAWFDVVNRNDNENQLKNVSADMLIRLASVYTRCSMWACRALARSVWRKSCSHRHRCRSSEPVFRRRPTARSFCLEYVSRTDLFVRAAVFSAVGTSWVTD